MKWFYQLSHKKRVWLTVGAWMFIFLGYAICRFLGIDPQNLSVSEPTPINMVASLVLLASFVPGIWFTVFAVKARKAEKATQEAEQVANATSLKPDHQDDFPLTEEEKARRAAAEATRAEIRAGIEEEKRLRIAALKVQSRRAVDKELAERAERIAEYKRIIKEYNEEQIANDKPFDVVRVEGLDDTDNSEEATKE